MEQQSNPYLLSDWKEIRIPDEKGEKQEVVRISHNNQVYWENSKVYHYVSFGDSIAAGHAINDDWEGVGTQYGENGNKSTKIISGCYTDLIDKFLKKEKGESFVDTISYAHSGDHVFHLIEKLSHKEVKNSIKKANLITICIGANDVLTPAMENFKDYVLYRDISGLEKIIEQNLLNLEVDTSTYSYKKLFEAITELNPTAKCIFTTIYNPYRFLWLDDGVNGFFRPLLSSIPNFSILGFNVTNHIKDYLLSTDIVRLLFDRVNNMHSYAEKFVTKLNEVLINKINEYKKVNPNFFYADTKTIFDSIPDRPIKGPGENQKYNEMVNVEFTRGFTVGELDWGALWRDHRGANLEEKIENYWQDLAFNHVSFSGIDIESIATELVTDIAEKVIAPDADPHPEEEGQKLLYKSFLEVLGKNLPRLEMVYNSNNTKNEQIIQKIAVPFERGAAWPVLKPCAFSPETGYYFTHWLVIIDGKEEILKPGDTVRINYNASQVEIRAQWSNIYKIKIWNSEDSPIYGSKGETGPQECYEIWVHKYGEPEGQKQPALGEFGTVREYYLQYGSIVGIVVRDKSGTNRSYITLNGERVSGKSNQAAWDFVVTSHMKFNLEWNYTMEASWPFIFNWWNCYVTTS